MLSTALNSVAQSGPGKPEVGVLASEGISWYNGTSSRPAIAIGFGAYSHFAIGRKVSLDPKLMLTLMGASALTVPLPSQYSKNTFDTTGVKRASFYFTIVAPVSFPLSDRFAIGIGPQFMVLANTSDQYKSTIGNDLLVTDSRNSLHKYDAGINTSVSYKKATVEIGLMYYYGLMYIVKNDAIPAKNSGLQLWIALPVKKRKATTDH